MASEEFTGFQDLGSDSGDFAAQQFQIEQALGRIRTGGMVKVISVTPGGRTGRISVQPLVSQVDGIGNTTPHGVINNLIYFRLQGGASAVIIDPVVGDVGWAAFADRDISSVKETADVGPPGSRRRFDMADGIYFGGCINGNPTQIVDMTGGNIAITSTGNVTINAANLIVRANMSVTGDVATTGTLKNNGKDVGSTHEHTLTQPGTGVSGPPA